MLAYEPTQADKDDWARRIHAAPVRVKKIMISMPPWRVLEFTSQGILAWGTLAAIDPRSGRIDVDVLLSIGHTLEKAVGVDPDDVVPTESDDVVGDDMRVATYLYRTGRIN